MVSRGEKATGAEPVPVEDLSDGRVGAATPASRSQLADFLNDLEDGYYEVDIAGNFTAVNDALCRMYGITREQFIGRNNRDHTAPDVAERMYATFNQVYRTGAPVTGFVYENMRADGGVRVEEISAHLVRNDAGEPIGFRGITRDVTERQRDEAYERTRNRALKMLARNAPLEDTLAEVLEGLHVQMPDSTSAILTLDEDGESLQLAAANGPAEAYLGQFGRLRLATDALVLKTAGTAATAVTIGFAQVASVAGDPIADRAGFRSRVAYPILSSEQESLGVLLVCWEREHGADPRETQWLQTATAEAEIAISHHQLVSRLAHLSQRDALTGLLNRRSFMEQGGHGLALARRHGWTPGLVFLDLDNFKPVNDTYGHQAGDQLLMAIAERLGRVVRETDSVARLGGDEFAIFAADLGGAGAASLPQRVQAALAEPIDIGVSHRIEVQASIGVALADRSEDSLDNLLAEADRAMYRAKARGGGWEVGTAKRRG